MSTDVHTSKYFLFCLIAVFCAITSCAGPTHPWGNHGLTLPSQKFAPMQSLKNSDLFRRIAQQESTATLEFFPKKQNLTELSGFSIVINNKSLIERDFMLKLFYNQYDVTDDWIKNSKISFNNQYTQLKIEFQGLKLLPTKDHDILVKFKNNRYTKAQYFRYQEPHCSLSSYTKLRQVSPFRRVPKKRTQAIEEISKKNDVNPHFIAGLIAQESAFNPKAVSSAKAIGLTQVTNIAQPHILEQKKWPTNQAITEYSVPIIKTMILTGAINPQNEWRLNEKQSIEGGITFLKYLEAYWLAPENRRLIYKHYGNNMDVLNELILASYNSGAYRVKMALRKYGRSWKNDAENLGEARKYIKRINSYCEHFDDELVPALAKN